MSDGILPIRQVAGKESAPACLRAVIIHRPGAHPLWYSYYAAIIHLRPIEGLPPAGLLYPDASHELQLWAMDPRLPIPNESPVVLPPGSLLRPQNLVHQLRAMSDGRAGELFDAFVQAIATRRLSPDTDHRRDQIAWLDRWGKAS